MKNASIYVSLLVLIVFINNACSNQAKITGFTEKEVVFKFEEVTQSSRKYSFLVKRIFINNEGFIDKKIICSDTTNPCNVKFSIKNNSWQVWNGRGWVDIFNKEGQIKTIDLPRLQKTIKPIKPYILGEDTLYAFSSRDESGDYNGDYTQYLLSKKHGIVILKRLTTLYKRSDYSNDNLDSLIKNDHAQWER